MSISTTNLKEWQNQQGTDPEFVAASEQQEIGYQITRLRILRGLTRAQLAEMVGTRQPLIARLENGSSVSGMSFLDCIAKALDARIELRVVPR